jgi:hypothetical protein
MRCAHLLEMAGEVDGRDRRLQGGSQPNDQRSEEPLPDDAGGPAQREPGRRPADEAGIRQPDELDKLKNDGRG